MNYTMTTPCKECPFLKKFAHGFSIGRLHQFATGEFHCHETGVCDEDTGDYTATDKSQHCAGALIFLEKRKSPHQMMRICERLGAYDRTKLDMKAKVR